MQNNTEDNFQRLIETVFRRKQAPMLVTVGKVSNIDEDEQTCDISIDEDLTLSNCRLNAIIDNYDNRLLIVPKNNSMVAFIAIGGKLTEPLIVSYSEIEKVLLTIGESDIIIKDGKIEMNGGDLGGLINIEDLVSHMNTIEDDINNLKNIMSGWSPVAQDGGAALKGAITTWAGQSITKTKKSDFEDTKITH